MREPLDLDATPQELLRALRTADRPFLLLGAWAGGGAILGASPAPGPLSVDMSTLTRPDAVGGGWFGWLGYGFGARIEDLPPPPPRPHPLPDHDVAFYDHVWRQDADGAWWFESLTDREPYVPEPGEARPWRLDGMTPRAPGFDGHRWAVEECKRRIAAGDLYQANLTLRLEGTLDGDPLDAFADATATQAPPYAAFFRTGRASILSFSPELFLRHHDGRAWSEPIKGTADTRGALEASTKDRAEHTMIVDLVRNDLGRVARYGTVTAGEPHITEHPGLFHMVSRVEAEVDAGAEALVRAAFPPGSVTGAPKIAAMQAIAALEATGREVYTGAIGYLSPLAGLELNVAIRTLEVADGKAWLGVGGGIVADSDPDGELAEALTKARSALHPLGVFPTTPGRWRRKRLPPLLEIPRPRGGLLETMLAVDGTIPLLDAHLQRLGDDAARAELELAAATAGDGRWRIRLVEGRVTVEPARPTTIDALVPRLIPGGLGDRKWADRRVPKDVLIVDADGDILEGAWANVFIVEAGVHVTPPADGRLLPGVTRARVIAGTQAREEPIDLDRLDAADAVYLTSAISLVTPVFNAACAPSLSARPSADPDWSPAPGR